MNFAELLQKYKDGSATEEERRLVEEEIEKNELINEYLGEQLPERPPLGELPLDSVSEKQEIKKINRAVNRKLLNMTCIVMALLIAAGAFVYYVALPAYDAQFYNPLASVEGVPDVRDGENEQNQAYIESFSPLYLSARAFTELHCPGWDVYDVKAESLGMGKYDVKISSQHYFNGKNEFTCVIDKGEQVQGIASDWFFDTGLTGVFYDKGPQVVMFVQDDGSYTYAQEESSRAMYRDALPDLPKSSQISAYVSFTEDVSMEEMLSLEEEWDGCGIYWAAVRPNDSSYFHEIGIGVSGGGLVLEPTEEFEEMFPFFCQHGEKYRESELSEAEKLAVHFTSQLKYMSRQEDFIHALCAVNGYSAIDYQEILDYIEQNGIKIYGVYVIGDRDSMIALEQRKEINSFMIEDIKLSIFS